MASHSLITRRGQSPAAHKQVSLPRTDRETHRISIPGLLLSLLIGCAAAFGLLEILADSAKRISH